MSLSLRASALFITMILSISIANARTSDQIISELKKVYPGSKVEKALFGYICKQDGFDKDCKGKKDWNKFLDNRQRDISKKEREKEGVIAEFIGVGNTYLGITLHRTIQENGIEGTLVSDTNLNKFHGYKYDNVPVTIYTGFTYHADLDGLRNLFPNHQREWFREKGISMLTTMQEVSSSRKDEIVNTFKKDYSLVQSNVSEFPGINGYYEGEPVTNYIFDNKGDQITLVVADLDRDGVFSINTEYKSHAAVKMTNLTTR